MSKLKNKIIIVTGGSGLLGTAFIKELKQQGGIVINADISCSKNLDKGEYYCDITQESTIVELINEITIKYGKIDGWVNNAYPRTKDWGNKLEDVKFKSWQKNIDIHLNGYFLCCQKVLELMKKQRSGSVVNMSSIYGMLGPDFSIYQKTGMTNPVAYAAIKGGLINLTKYLASYFGEYNVRVNCVSPGGVFDAQPKVFVENYEAKVPLKRMAKPKDIAPSVAFLLSDDASYITGHNLVVDGGWSII